MGVAAKYPGPPGSISLGMPAKARPTVVQYDTFSAAIGAAVAGAGIALGRNR